MNNDKEFLVQKIRTKYTEKEITQLDVLKALDERVNQPAKLFAYIFGIIGSLVMGWGMCLAMNVIEPGVYFGITINDNMLLQGIVIGIIGIFAVSVNYSVYKRILASRRKKYADEIVSLSDKILEG